MISLICVPFLFWILSKPTVENLNLRVLDLGLPYKLKKGETENLNRIPIDGWNYETINLPQNFDEKNEKIYSEKIKKLQTETEERKKKTKNKEKQKKRRL